MSYVARKILEQPNMLLFLSSEAECKSQIGACFMLLGRPAI